MLECATLMANSAHRQPFARQGTSNRHSSIVDLFLECVIATPEAPAVIDGARSITYRELHDRARRLADALIEEGVGNGSAVPIIAERSIEAVIGILGVLEAGGAYIGIKPSDVEQRLEGIVKDSGAVLAVGPHPPTVKTSLKRFVWTEAVRAIPRGVANRRRCEPDDIAAVVYTSGSTGAPKGVEISHRAIMARMRHGYVHRRNDLQRASLQVVAHFSDLLLPLVCGGPVIIVPDDCLTNSRGLLRLFDIYSPSRMVFVPSQLWMLLDGGADIITALQRLDTIIVSGEALAPGLVARCKDLLPRIALANGYGATEVAGLACIGEVHVSEPITVGRPLDSCKVYVLDEEQRTVPIGCAGEVYIGGSQVARGYRSQPALTGARFIDDPFGDSRMFRTGDIGEFLPDGRLRILGRVGQEVKVRGLWANLNDVEAALEVVPGVRRAVVVATRGQDLHTRLAAHVVRDSCILDERRLRESIAQRLPSHMVPQQIEFVHAISTLPNGKVDRTSIERAILDQPSNDLEIGPIAPSTNTESLLMALWRQLLGRAHIEPTDEFFAVGGDSLDAQRFVLRAEELGLPVTLDDMADGLALIELAERIDARRHAGDVEGSDKRPCH